MMVFWLLPIAEEEKKSIHPEVKKFTILYNLADDLFDGEMVENHFNGKTSKIFIH